MSGLLSCSIVVFGCTTHADPQPEASADAPRSQVVELPPPPVSDPPVFNGRKSGFPYRLMAHYYARGAMGYGMGKLEVLEHDGHGNIAFSEHPFVVMKDDAWVDLTLLRHRLLR